MAVEVSNKFLLGGEFELQPEKRRLMRDGASIHLANRPFQVLLYLIEHRERVVSRQELLEHFWDGRDVYDETLTKCVGAIRKALDDQQKDLPRLIETRWAEGYRFIGSVEITPARNGTVTGASIEQTNGSRAGVSLLTDAVLEPEKISHPPAASLPATKPKRWPPPIVLVSVIIAIALGTVFLVARYRSRSSDGQAAGPIRSVAVLPLKNLSEDQAANEYFSDGMTESLITALSRIDGLRVTSQSSVLRFKGKDIDPKEVGKQLDVAAVLEGSVRKTKDSVRVVVRLVSVEDGRVLWTGDTHDRAIGDLFALQDEIAHSLVAGLRVQLSSESERALARRYTDDVEAYELYIKGRFFWNKRTEEGLRRSIELFEQAQARDSNYALAYAGLADAYVHLNLYSAEQQRDAFPRAKEAAEHALKIDETLAEAHATLGYIKEQYDWNWAGAEAEFKRAIELSPNYATAHQYYSEYLALLGRTEESVTQITRAHQLDPYSLIINTELSYPHICARNWDEALVQLNKALDMDSSFPLAVYYAARCRVHKGEFEQGIEEARRAVTVSGGSFVAVAGLGYAYAAAGRKEQAREVLRDLTTQSERRYVPPYLIATLYAGLGEKDRAFAWLEKAYEQRDYLMVMLRIDPRLDNLRSDPAFASLLRRVGLAP